MASRERELAGEIKSMFALARQSEAARSFSAAVQARIKITALRTELARLRDEREAEQITDPLERVRRLLRLATEAGSYQAATALVREEARIVEARDQISRPDELEEATDEELLEVILGTIAGLPDPVVVRIREACTDRLGGPHLRAI